jgi:DNA-binding PadR family transcriptional regulator
MGPRHFGWESFAFGFGPRGFGFGGPRHGRRQWFGSGDMKYVILKLLSEKPMHGYEVMKALEERLHGCYSPSPGTVYPTLQWLEDESLVKSRDVEGKKVYEITDAGRKFLREHRDVIDDIFDRVKEAVDDVLGGGMDEVNRSLGRLVKEVYRLAWRAEDQTQRKRVVEVLKRATQELENLSSNREA